jgi:hypothetical protein
MYIHLYAQIYLCIVTQYLNLCIHTLTCMDMYVKYSLSIHEYKAILIKTNSNANEGPKTHIHIYMYIYIYVYIYIYIYKYIYI